MQLWGRETFHPDAAVLDSEAQRFLVQGIMGETDANYDRQISFDEFIPWCYAVFLDTIGIRQHWLVILEFCPTHLLPSFSTQVSAHGS